MLMGIQRPLPNIDRNSDYHTFLHELRKNHNMAKLGLEETRSGSAELSTKGDHGFYSFKELALGACNHPSVVAIDKERSFYKRIEEIRANEAGSFHRVNSVLDAAINQMNRVRPAPSPTEGKGVTENIHNVATAVATASVEIEIRNLVEKSESEIESSPKGSPERSFLERLKARLIKTKDIAAMLVYTLQAVHDSGILVDKAREILSRLM